MKTRTSLYGLITVAGALLLMQGCSPQTYGSASSYTDDLYATHDRQKIAEQERKEAEIAQAQAEARAARIKASIAQAEADRLQRQSESTGNPYQDILAEDYESAYARRLRGFESPTYKMPSSYYNFRFSDASFYASAYDPAFYNVIVMGDEVWVEPKYVTSMFGYWGAPSFGFGWNSPGWHASSSWYWGWRNSYWDPWYPYWGYNWGWNSHWNWGWNYPHHGWGGGGHWSSNRPHYRPNTTHRRDEYRGTTASGGGYRNPASTSGSTYRGGTSSYRNNNSSAYRNNNASGSYNNNRGSSTSGSSGSYRNSGSSYQGSYSGSSSGGSYGSSGGGSYGGSRSGGGGGGGGTSGGGGGSVRNAGGR